MNLFFQTGLIILATAFMSRAQVMIDSGFYHLRNTEPREWTEFPEHAFGKEMLIKFDINRKEMPEALSLRQYDVKGEWIVELNGSTIGSLNVDEKDLIEYFLVDQSVMRYGSNTLRVFSKDLVADDIRVGELQRHATYQSNFWKQALVKLEIVDEKGVLIPAHITILDERRILQPFARDLGPYAARTGHLYTGSGKAALFLQDRTYTIFAGRGFEYSVDSVSVKVVAGDSIQKQLQIKREVNTEGWISSDPHVHTFTHSHHGDATDRERVITLAGEGIELPVITDHNQHVSLNAVAKRLHLDNYLTLMTGNEVTSKVGHFNVFPIDSTESIKSSTPADWRGLQANIHGYKHEPKVVILNHARDIHSGFRPHDPPRFLSVAGQRLDGNPMFANAMEVINSGSQQSDWMRLFRDWMYLLNSGLQITPVGSSDSHDVSRFIVGQGRTYIQANDSVAGAINVFDAVENFVAGKVMVSCGLLTSVKVNGQFGPGETAPINDKPSVDIEVSGPGWTKVGKIVLYVNGEKYREEIITGQSARGVKWKGKWELPILQHDYHVIAIAEGPGSNMPFWPIAKPYQPTSPDWKPTVIGASGAVWVDGDQNGKRESANDYARKIMTQSSGNTKHLVELLQAYDEAVAIQVAATLHLRKVDLTSKKIQTALKHASQKTRSGFERVRTEIQKQ